MGIILALFIFQQTHAYITWPKYGGTLENTHLQILPGKMATEPIVLWSHTITHLGGTPYPYGATVDDVDGDGDMEVVVGMWDNKVYCLNGVLGTEEWSYPTGGHVNTAPALANVDEDDTMEVVIGSNDDKVYCLNGVTGEKEWDYTTGGDVCSSPAIADLDGNGTMEVVFGSCDGYVYCLNGIGGGKKWSHQTWGEVTSCPAIANLDTDAELEVVIGSKDIYVYCLNGSTGGEKWKQSAGMAVESSPAIADIDGDGIMEVVIGSNSNKVYYLNGKTGAEEWNHLTYGDVWSSPAIANVAGDAGIEVVIGSQDKYLYCLNGTKTKQWDYYRPQYIHRGVSIADLDDNGKYEIVLPNETDTALVCLNGEDKSVLWIKALTDDIHDISIADIDLDGCVELVCITTGSCAGEQTVVALDETPSCKGMSIEESGYTRQDRIEFKVIGQRVYLSTPYKIEADIRIYDLSGRLNNIVYTGTLSKGEHIFNPEIKNRGIYFAVFSTNSTPIPLKQSVKIVRF